MRTSIGALTVLLLASTAQAETSAAPPSAPNTAYRYVDERGVIHWAQSIYSVPEAYVSRAVTPDFHDPKLFPAVPPYVKPAALSALAITVDYKPPLPSLHGWWTAETRRLVTAAWKGLGQDGRQPLLSFYVVRDGRISIPDVDRSSGDFAYDLKARDTLINLRRLPPLPPDFPDTRLHVQLGFAHVR